MNKLDSEIKAHNKILESNTLFSKRKNTKTLEANMDRFSQNLIELKKSKNQANKKAITKKWKKYKKIENNSNYNNL